MPGRGLEGRGLDGGGGWALGLVSSDESALGVPVPLSRLSVVTRNFGHACAALIRYPDGSQECMPNLRVDVSMPLPLHAEPTGGCCEQGRSLRASGPAYPAATWSVYLQINVVDSLLLCSVIPVACRLLK